MIGLNFQNYQFGPPIFGVWDACSRGWRELSEIGHL